MNELRARIPLTSDKSHGHPVSRQRFARSGSTSAGQVPLSLVQPCPPEREAGDRSVVFPLKRPGLGSGPRRSCEDFGMPASEKELHGAQARDRVVRLEPAGSRR